MENQKKKALSKLIIDMGIDTLPEDKQGEIILKLSESLLKRIFLESMEKIGEQGRDEYEKASEKFTAPGEMETFFSEKIQDYDKMVERVVEEFKSEMIAVK